MPDSAGAPASLALPVPPKHLRGFTLMELLVVLVIISIGISSVVIALQPDSRGAVRQEGDRLAALLELADEESNLGGAPLAWVGREDGYEFQRRILTDLGPDWVVVRGDDLLHPRQLPGTAIRSIRLDDTDLAFGQRVPLGSKGAHRLEVVLAQGDARARISGQNGRFQSDLMDGDREGGGS